MSSLLSTPAVDYCQKSTPSGLRGRRFSLNPTLPQISFGRPGTGANDSTLQNESAIDSDDDPPNDTTPSLPSPLSNVYMSGYSTNVYIPRHQGSSLPTPGPSLPATPATECPPSTAVDRSGSIIELMGGQPSTAPTPKLDRMKQRLACAYFLYFLCGWGDGVTGTALPYLKAQFNLSDMLTSALFCGSTVGFFIGTFVVEHVTHRFGLYHIGRKSMIPAWLSLHRPTDNVRNTIGFSTSQARFNTLVSASIVHSSFFILMGVRLGFSAMFIAYATAALARAFLTASLNEYLASGPKQAMGYAYGLWAFGGAFAPLVCQSIIAAGAPWPNFYYGSLVVSAINLGFVVYSFRPTQRERFAERKEALAAATPRSSPGTPTDEDREIALSPLTPEEKENTSSSTTLVAAQPQGSGLLRAFRLPLVWAFAVFGWLYCGSETTTQGFAVSYLLATRNANPKTVGYVTSGFNGGLAVGRVLWGYFSPKLNFMQRKTIIVGFMGMLSINYPCIW
ncbi:mfs efflux transporter [Moniliophthora roreri MCA 2997]|uniref:Mfs efflux transporter n=1 Tax=Moniliophthora roreri (strain MCA 2997) TaxID=1381753 RepID=V2XH83_MONRO|nr:mfs efflux transporter [Moniliophthora roreri MCA 2997]